MPRKRPRRPATKCSNVHQHIIRSLRTYELQSQVFQAIAEQLPHVGVLFCQPGIVALRQRKPSHSGLLQRCGGAHRKEIVYFPRRVNNFREAMM